MATLALGLAGAALGNAALGTATVLGLSGAQLGFIAGSALGGLLFPADGPPDQFVEGPRLTDTKIQTSSYGEYLVRPYGAFRLSGNIMWASDVREEVTTSTQSAGGGKGGGGGGSVTTTSYAYFRSFAIGICEGPITNIDRVWAGTELIYDRIKDESRHDIDLFLGTDTQEKSSTISSFRGAENTAAYRDTAYVVFFDFPLTDYGNSIPLFSFEVQVTA